MTNSKVCQKRYSSWKSFIHMYPFHGFIVIFLTILLQNISMWTENRNSQMVCDMARWVVVQADISSMATWALIEKLNKKHIIWYSLDIIYANLWGEGWRILSEFGDAKWDRNVEWIAHMYFLLKQCLDKMTKQMLQQLAILQSSGGFMVRVLGITKMHFLLNNFTKQWTHFT